jgi:hypothetical protein
MRRESNRQTGRANFTPSVHSLEVTGLGVIAALLVAFGGLVGDGSLPLSQYLVFAGFLLVSTAGLTWRIWKLAPARAAKSGEPREPGN